MEVEGKALEFDQIGNSLPMNCTTSTQHWNWPLQLSQTIRWNVNGYNQSFDMYVRALTYFSCSWGSVEPLSDISLYILRTMVTNNVCDQLS